MTPVTTQPTRRLRTEDIKRNEYGKLKNTKQMQIFGLKRRAWDPLDGTKTNKQQRMALQTEMEELTSENYNLRTQLHMLMPRGQANKQTVHRRDIPKEVPMGFRNAQLFDRIGNDELGVINGFVPNNRNLSLASRGIWRLLGRDNIHLHTPTDRRYFVDDTNIRSFVTDSMLAISEPTVSLEDTSFVISNFTNTRRMQTCLPYLYKHIHTLSITGELVSLDGALLGLKEADHLHTLELEFGCQNYHSYHREVCDLAALAHAPSLKTLYLGLSHNRIDGDEIQALEVLKNAPELQVLRIDLRGNPVGESAGSASIKGARALATLKYAPNLHTLHLQLEDASLGPADAAMLSRLCESYLHTLRIDLSGNEIEDPNGLSGCVFLAMLKDAPSLRNLTLNLQSQNPGLTNANVMALAALKDAHVLEVLKLHFGGNASGIDQQGAHALAGLKNAHVLHTLTLGLNTTQINDTGVQDLTRLKDNPTLTYLDLGLNGTPIGDDAAQALAGLNTMHTLKLDLSDTNITPVGALALAALKHAQLLHTLHINLTATLIGDIGVQSLVALQNAPALHTLSLDLGQNRIGRRGTMALGTLKNLHSLHLSLNGNVIQDAGATDLAELRHAPNLRTLYVDLGHNQIGDAGVADLVKLRHAPNLKTLSLGLSDNQIGDAGARELVALGSSPVLNTLALQLSGNQFGIASSAVVLGKLQKLLRPWNG
jgi:hypothetical protein